MSYHVKTEVFDGPFDLLLHLVARQKVDIGAISIGDIADQYLEYVEAHEDEFDLDIASDFLLVAAQLLQMKADSLLPSEEASYGDELDDLAPEEAREILISRLIAYKQFKSAALALGSRAEAEGRMHPRSVGIEPEFLNLVPDYLEGVTLRGLAVICADLASRRDAFLLEAEHIAAMPIPVELHVQRVEQRLEKEKSLTFTELLGGETDPPQVVVTFLALLELYKRRIISLHQDVIFGEIDVAYLEGPHDADSSEPITSVIDPIYDEDEENEPDDGDTDGSGDADGQ